MRENGYSVVGEEESPQSSHQGNVSKRYNGIVCEIDGILLVLQKREGESVVRLQAKPDMENATSSDLGDPKIFDCWDFVAYGGPRRLSAFRSWDPGKNGAYLAGRAGVP